MEAPVLLLLYCIDADLVISIKQDNNPTSFCYCCLIPTFLCDEFFIFTHKIHVQP